MRTQIIEKVLYKFEELPENIKQKAIENLYDINTDFDWWDYEDFTNICEILGFSFPDKQKFYFSGFSSQGDGACFAKAQYSYKKDSVKKLNEYAPIDEELHRISKELQKLQKSAFYTGTAYIEHSGHYYHERSMHIDVNCERGIFDYDEFREIIADLCHWFYKSLEKQYEYWTSDEAIIETIESNEYEFDENGNLS